LQGKFSMPYLLARAIIDGRLFLDAFTDSAVRDDNVLRLAEKIQMHLDPDLQPTAQGSRPCKVTIRLRDGRSFSRQIDYAKGSREAPMTAEELKQKFVGCARQALDDSSIERIIEDVEHLETLQDIRPLCRLLIGANRS
jgi:2-methylcitrate dehydratase PrpD